MIDCCDYRMLRFVPLFVYAHAFMAVRPRPRLGVHPHPPPMETLAIPYEDHHEVDPIRWVPTYVDAKPPKIALDVECGIGDSTLELAQRLSKEWTVLGIDSDPNRVALANQKHPSLTFWTGDLSIFPAASLDKVQVHAGRMLHVKDKWAFAGELARVLRPGGTLDLFDFTLSHSLIHELFHMEETLRQQYFCGWSSYDPAWHRHLFAKRRLQFQQTVLHPEEKMVHTTFVK